MVELRLANAYTAMVFNAEGYCHVVMPRQSALVSLPNPRPESRVEREAGW